MDGDMNDIFQKLNSMLSDKETSDNLKNILNNFSSSNDSTNEDDESTTNKEDTSCNKNQNNNSNPQSSNSRFDDSKSDSNNFNFDINTILKLKSVMDAMNNPNNDSRSQLLLSLKPYLRDSKKDKIDQYIKLLNLANVIQVMNPSGGENKKNE